MSEYGREVLEAPESAVINGECQMGTFKKGIGNLNLLEARKPLGKSYPLFFNNFRLKEWEAFQISNDDFFICVAVSNIKFIATSLLFIYDKKSRSLYDYIAMGPAKNTEVPSGLQHSDCSCKSGSLNIMFRNRLDDKRFEIEFSASSQKGNPACEGRFSAEHITEPIVIVQPFATNRPLYSHKAMMPGSGELTLGEKSTVFQEKKTSLIVDDHKGFYPYHLRYDWITAMGYAEKNHVGFNLTDNQVLEPEKYNENCLWSNKKMIPLPPVKFDRSQGLKKTWKISDSYGRVNLNFTPLAGAPLRKGMGPVSLFYYGPFGRYEGFILDDKDNPVDFTGFIGMGEKRSDKM